jgi:hypothetical protein
MKRALRQAERRAGDGSEIGGTGATILKFLAAPLARLASFRFRRGRCARGPVRRNGMLRPLARPRCRRAWRRWNGS